MDVIGETFMIPAVKISSGFDILLMSLCQYVRLKPAVFSVQLRHYRANSGRVLSATLYRKGTAMPFELPETNLPAALADARVDAISHGLPYAGRISPAAAWELASRGQALLVDVRSNEERVFVGYVPGSVHVPWATGTALIRNPRFVREPLARLGSKDKVALLLCPSGKKTWAEHWKLHNALTLFNPAPIT